MNLFQIAWRSLRQRWLSSALTALSVALGVALIVAVLLAYGVVSRMFSEVGTGYDLLIGPKGADTQLVLSAIYRIQPPIENLPWRFYEDLKKDKRLDRVVPISIGDTTEEGGFPIVGTLPEYFMIPYARRGDGTVSKFRSTGWMKSQWDAVIGSEVARANGWDVGSTFRMIHGGADAEDGHVHNELFTVRGVLEPTGTPNDRSAFVNLQGFNAISGHDTPIAQAIEREAEFYGETVEEIRERNAEIIAEVEAEEAATGYYHGPTPDLSKEVTAVIATMKDRGKSASFRASEAMRFIGEMKSGFKAQAVNPVVVMRRLVNTFVGNLRDVMLALTVFIVLVAGNGIFVSVYNSMADRKREIGVMRALGARRQTMFGVILAETFLLCVGGGLLGFVLGHGLVVAAAPLLRDRTGLIIDPWHFEPAELLVFPLLLVLSLLVGVLPAMTAYRTDVASALSD